MQIIHIISIFQLIDEKCPNCRLELSINDDALKKELELNLKLSEDRILKSIEKPTEKTAIIELFDDSPHDKPFKELEVFFDQGENIRVINYRENNFKRISIWKYEGIYPHIKNILNQIDFGQ